MDFPALRTSLVLLLGAILVSPLPRAYSAPQSKPSIEPMRAAVSGQKLTQEDFQARMARLAEVDKFLRHKFVGWEDTIDKLMAAAKTIELTPGLVNRPYIIPLFSLPGSGKTTLVQNFVEEMGWGKRFRQVNITESSEGIPVSPLIELANKNPEEKNLQAAILIDEWQKLKKVTEVEGEVKADSPYYDAGAARAKTEANKMWQILGNGTYQQPSQYTTQQYVEWLQTAKGNLDGYDSKIDSAKRQLEELNLLKATEEAKAAEALADAAADAGDPETGVKPEASKFDAQITKIEQQIETLKAQKTHYTDVQGLQTFQTINNDRKDAFNYKGKSIPLKEMAKEFAEDPAKFIAEFSAATDFLSLDPYVEVKRVIIFVTGNPEDVYAPAVAQFLSLKEEEQTPDQLRGLIANLNAPEKMKKWALDRIGSDGAWGSRWEVDKWKMQLPLSSEEWRELARRTVSDFGSSVEDRMKEYGRPIRLQYDATLPNMLFDATVDPLGGPRVMVSSSSQLVGSFFTDLQAELVTLPKKQLPKSLTISFDSHASSLVARPTGPAAAARVPFEFSRKITIEKKKINRAVREQSWELKRKTHHLAGHVVVGMETFGSLPEEFSRQLAPFEIAGGALWRNPGNLHSFKLNQVKMLLGGGIAQDFPEASGFLLPETAENVKQAKAVLRELAEDNQARKGLLANLPEIGRADPPTPVLTAEGAKEVAQISELPEMHALTGGHQGTDEMLAKAYAEADLILKRNRPLVSRIAQELEEVGMVSPDRLKVLVAENSAGLSQRIVQALMSNRPGRVDVYCMQETIANTLAGGRARAKAATKPTAPAPAAHPAIADPRLEAEPVLAPPAEEGFFVPWLKNFFGD